MSDPIYIYITRQYRRDCNLSLVCLFWFYTPLSVQSVDTRAVNPGVVSSNPGSANFLSDD